MPGDDLVRMVPILTGRAEHLAPMVAFWQRLGLHVTADHGDYVILATDAEAADAVEVHLAQMDGHDPRVTAGSVYLRVRDARALWQRLHDELAAAGTLYRAPASGLTSELVEELRAREDAGEVLTRLHDLEDKPWGITEFGVIDPAGWLVRVGSPIAS